MSWTPRKAVCSRCGRHRSAAFLQPMGDGVGLYCPTCRKAVLAAKRTLHAYVAKSCQHVWDVSSPLDTLEVCRKCGAKRDCEPQIGREE